MEQLKESPSGSLSQVSNPVSSDHMSVQECCTDPISTHSISCQTNISLPTNSSDDALSKMFSDLMSKEVSIPDYYDYLVYTAQESVVVPMCYKLSKGIGTMRTDDNDSCFPCKRMPMGMLEYMADFFSFVQALASTSSRLLDDLDNLHRELAED